VKDWQKNAGTRGEPSRSAQNARLKTGRVAEIPKVTLFKTPPGGKQEGAQPGRGKGESFGGEGVRYPSKDGENLLKRARRPSGIARGHLPEKDIKSGRGAKRGDGERGPRPRKKGSARPRRRPIKKLPRSKLAQKEKAAERGGGETRKKKKLLRRLV